MTTNKDLPRYSHTDEEWAQRLQTDFEEYMAGCYDQVDNDWLSDVSENFETVSGVEYCGCQDCETREILMFLVPRIIEGYKDGKIVLED
jgi:hypothetical protein